MSSSQPLAPAGDGEEDFKGDSKSRKDFDCPECNANNPYDDGIKPGDEVRCFYCGLEFKVTLTDEGKWRFREV